MKFTKRILAVFLTLALALGLALPTMAAVNWDEFRITKQPQNLTIKHGDSFTLNVEVNVPDGVEVEYQWHRLLPIAGATASELEIGSDDTFLYPNANGSEYYFCKITAYEKDADGTTLASKTLTSDRACVTAQRVDPPKTFWDKINGITWEPFVDAFSLSLMNIVLSYGLLLPVSPILFLVYLIISFIQGFRGLF